jgi:hypothetical protein
LKPFHVSEKALRKQAKRMKTDSHASEMEDPRMACLHGLEIEEWFNVVIRASIFK